MKGGKREGAGRKRIGKSKQIVLTLPDEAWEALERKLNREGKKQAEFIRELVEKAI